MSGRSGYTEDSEHLHLYRATVERSIAGKRGQAFLARARKALEGMPIKGLTEGRLDSPDGCCVMGAVARSEHITVAGVNPACSVAVGRVFDISAAMAAEIAFVNDGEWDDEPETSEQRHRRVLAWVEANIRT